MSDVSSLFCTPGQGRRISELEPEIKAEFYWPYFGNLPNPYKHPVSKYNLSETDRLTAVPALTLQELNHFARNSRIAVRSHSSVYGNSFELGIMVRTKTAPELAEWIIGKLEEVT